MRFIRNVAIVLYFKPFETIRLYVVSRQLEQEVVGLIQMEKIMGGMDSQNKVRFCIYFGVHAVWEIVAKHRYDSLVDFGR